MRPPDTTPEAAREQRKILARMSGGERLSLAFEMSEAVRRLAVSGIERRLSPASHEELVVELIRLCYGEPTALPPER